MSAAIWSQPDPADAHPGLGPATMSPEALAGRVASATSGRIRVRLQAWGSTPEDAQRAIDAFGWHPGRNAWELVDTATTTGGINTIRRADPKALAQRANYGWAWAVYAAPAHEPGGES